MPLLSCDLLPRIFRLGVQLGPPHLHDPVPHRREVVPGRHIHVDARPAPAAPLLHAERYREVELGTNLNFEPGNARQVWQRLRDIPVQSRVSGGGVVGRPRVGAACEAEDPQVRPGWAVLRGIAVGGPCLAEEVWQVDHVIDAQLLESGGHGKDRLGQLERGADLKRRVGSSEPPSIALEV